MSFFKTYFLHFICNIFAFCAQHYNGRRGEELEKAQEYAERTTPEKPSIRERLEDAKRECAEHKPPEGKKPSRDVPEHDCL